MAGRPLARDAGGGAKGLSFSSFLCGTSDGPFLLCDGNDPHNSNEVDFDINPTGVYVAVHTKQWDLSIERLKVYPREASTWVVRYCSSAGAGDNGNSDPQSPTLLGATSPRSPSGRGGGKRIATLTMTGQRALKWRMLPLHAALLFNGPIDVVRALVKAYPRACSAHDDQGMLPLHIAFRAGASEEIVLTLLSCFPEAIERVDYCGRLPSNLAPKDIVSYGDTIGEAFVRGPSYYYWAVKVATADRIRSEMAIQARIRDIEESARASDERYKELLESTEKHCIEEVGALSMENVELKDRIAWYESTYDGAEEKNKVLVEHTNSLAERLRLASQSEKHLAMKVARLEAKLRGEEDALGQEKDTSFGERQAFEDTVAHLSKSLENAEHKAETLTKALEYKVQETNEMKAQFEKDRQTFEKQLDRMKEFMTELIASSREEKQIFDQESKELRRQLATFQSEIQMASLEEKRKFAKDSQELRLQLQAIQSEMKRNADASQKNAVLPRSLDERLERLQYQLEDNAASFMNRVSILEGKDDEKLKVALKQQSSTARKIEDRLDRLQKEVESARFLGGLQQGDETANSGVHKNKSSKETSATEPKKMHSTGVDAPAKPNTRRSGAHEYNSSKERVATEPTTKHSRGINLRHNQEPDGIVVKEDGLVDTYVSTKSVVNLEYNKSNANSTREEDEMRDEYDAIDTMDTSYSLQSNVDGALGELTEEQTLVLESLNLSGNRDQIAKMLGRVPGLTKNQVNLLVDVATSLAA